MTCAAMSNASATSAGRAAISAAGKGWASAFDMRDVISAGPESQGISRPCTMRSDSRQAAKITRRITTLSPRATSLPAAESRSMSKTRASAVWRIMRARERAMGSPGR